ncbi:ATP-dependent helicase, partial [Bacillus sp. SIMBA_069]
TLVTPREVRQMMFIQKQTKAQVLSRNVPSLEEVAERKQEQLREQLTSLLESDSIADMYQKVADALVGQYPAEKVAA